MCLGGLGLETALNAPQAAMRVLEAGRVLPGVAAGPAHNEHSFSSSWSTLCNNTHISWIFISFKNHWVIEEARVKRSDFRDADTSLKRGRRFTSVCFWSICSRHLLGKGGHEWFCTCQSAIVCCVRKISRELLDYWIKSDKVLIGWTLTTEWPLLTWWLPRFNDLFKHKMTLAPWVSQILS